MATLEELAKTITELQAQLNVLSAENSVLKSQLTFTDTYLNKSSNATP